MSWFWMNIPAAAVFVAAWCGIPLYMVLKHPSWTSQPADSDERVVARSAKTAQPARPSSVTAATAAVEA
jgi:hypothetical protein